MTTRPAAGVFPGGGAEPTAGSVTVSRSLRATAPTTSPARTPAGPVATVRPDPRAWALALRIAGDDPRRCIPSPDGLSVLVANQPRR